MTRLVDLSHPVVDGEPGYRGMPAPRVEPHISHAASRGEYADGVTFEVSRVWMVGNSGTYLDSPAHRHPGGEDLAGLHLDLLAGLPTLCVDAIVGAGRRVVLDPGKLGRGLAGAALLLRTGWDVRRGTDAYWDPAPFVDEALARALVAERVRLVGVDWWNIDDPVDLERPAHTILLGAGIPIVEHLRGLDAVPTFGARFYAVPAPVRGAVSFPVRAFVELP